jgi:hypothetical protein
MMRTCNDDMKMRTCHYSKLDTFIGIKGSACNRPLDPHRR